jgi:hypothetical protein
LRQRKRIPALTPNFEFLEAQDRRAMAALDTAALLVTLAAAFSWANPFGALR